MRFDSIETYSDRPNARGEKTIVETFYLKDRDGNVLATFTKGADGLFSMVVNGSVADTSLLATATELNQFNDVSGYQESIIAAGALSVTKKYSGLAVVGGGAVTLAAPSASMLGQLKMVEMITDDGDVTLLLTNVVGQSSGTTATFDTAGDKLVLLAAFDKWVVLKELGVTLS